MFCRDQLVELEQARRDIEKTGAHVVAVSVDDREVSQSFAQELGLHIPLLSDPDLRVALAYGVAMEGRDIAIPAVFVVDRAGRIRLRKVGENAADRTSPAEILRVLGEVRGSASE
ncbi:MAG: peroxiredoxin family protein [Polyangiaceae bacterium]|nr:peroxiredoxin family protein [Polyangiaceae bacterium]